MTAKPVSHAQPTGLILPPRMDSDAIAAYCARLEQIRQGLSPYAVERVRLHLIGADGQTAMIVDDAGRTAWNAEGAGLALRVWRNGRDEVLTSVQASAEADPLLDLDDAARPCRRYVRLPATSLQDDAVLELRASVADAPAHLCDLARALWYMGESQGMARPRDLRTMYRAQAIAAADDSEIVGSLTLRGPLFGRRSVLAAAILLLLLPLLALIPMRSSVNGEGTVAIANAPAQMIDREGAVVALAAAGGARVEAGQPLFWIEDAQAGPRADAAYQRFAHTVRARLLDTASTEASSLPERLGELRVAVDARRVPVLAATAGTVRELPRIGEVFARGARIGFVMPDEPVFELDARVDPVAVDALAVGDTGRIRVADGREWPVQVTRIDARAQRATTEGRARSWVGVRARLLRDEGLLPEMPVDVQFDGRRMPVYRQLLRRWGTGT